MRYEALAGQVVGVYCEPSLASKSVHCKVTVFRGISSSGRCPCVKYVGVFRVEIRSAGATQWFPRHD
jgi:hypothetical protein